MKESIYNILNQVFEVLPRFFVKKGFGLESDYYTSLYDILKKNWVLILFVQSIFIIESLVVSSLPILIELALRNKDILIGIVSISGLLLVKPLVSLVEEYFNILFQSKIKFSLSLQANRFFLEVDPISHGTRSSGEVISKVTRLVSSIENFSDNFNYQLLPNLTPPIITVIYFMNFGPLIGLTTLGVLLTLATLSIIFNGITMNYANKIYNKDEDNLSKNIVQNLSQIFLIRASFATDIQFEHTLDLHQKMQKTFSAYYILITLLYGAIRILGAIGATIIVYMLLNANIDQPALVASTLLLLSSLAAVNSLGRNTSRIYKDYLNILEYFEFVGNFGKSTFKTIK